MPVAPEKGIEAMRLVKDNNPGAWAVSVRCIGQHHDINNAMRKYPRKGGWFILAEGYSDLDGEAFVAYYCAECATEIRTVEARQRRS